MSSVARKASHADVTVTMLNDRPQSSPSSRAKELRRRSMPARLQSAHASGIAGDATLPPINGASRRTSKKFESDGGRRHSSDAGVDPFATPVSQLRDGGGTRRKALNRRSVDLLSHEEGSRASVPARLRRVTLAEMSEMTRSASNLFDEEDSRAGSRNRRVTFDDGESLRAKSLCNLFHSSAGRGGGGSSTSLHSASAAHIPSRRRSSGAARSHEKRNSRSASQSSESLLSADLGHMKLASSEQGGLTLWANSPAPQRRPQPKGSRSPTPSKLTNKGSAPRRKSRKSLDIDSSLSRQLSSSTPNLHAAEPDSAPSVLLSPADMCLSKITHLNQKVNHRRSREHLLEDEPLLYSSSVERWKDSAKILQKMEL